MLLCNVTGSTTFSHTSAQLNPTNGTIVATYLLAQFNFRRIRLCLCVKHRSKPWCYRVTVGTEGLNTNPWVLYKGQIWVEKITRSLTPGNSHPPNNGKQYTVAATIWCCHRPIYSSVGAGRWRLDVTANTLQLSRRCVAV